MTPRPTLQGLALPLGLTITPIAVHGQEPFARSDLTPGSTVTVGQPVTITVSVFVPSFFQGAPAYAELDVDDAITVFNDQGSNLSERIAGQTWAGQSRSYTIYPQRSGGFEITDLSVEVRYRGDSGTVTATATAPSLRFEAYIPPEAAGLDYFIATIELRTGNGGNGK